jgi:hypothetical protein
MKISIRPMSLVLLCALFAPAWAQDGGARQWLAAINKDVWLPLMAGVTNDDESLYLGVRSKSYVRVQEQGRLLLNLDDYVDDTRAMMKNYRDKGTRLKMEVRFEERLIDGKSASESGVMRVTFSDKDGKGRTVYSRFHTISRKQADGWRVVTDYFPPTGSRFGEPQFERLKAPEDVADFLCYTTYPEKRERCDR